jgi:hypothetical protein
MSRLCDSDSRTPKTQEAAVSSQDEQIIGKLKMVGIFVLITLFGLFKGCADIRFAWGGEKTVATIMDTSANRGRHNRPVSQRVRYNFLDKDKAFCIGYDNVGLEWSPPADGQLKIVYLPGKQDVVQRCAVSRLQESSSVFGIMLLLVGLVGTAISGYMVFRFMENAASE